MDSKLKNLYKKFSDRPDMTLPANAKQRVKDKVFQRLGEVAPDLEQVVSWWAKLRASVLMRSYVLVPLVLVLFIISTAGASARALPGDILYPVKRQVESARILLAPNPEAKLELGVSFAEERLYELEKVHAADTIVRAQQEARQRSKNANNNKVANEYNDEKSNSNKSKTDKDPAASRQASSKRETRARQQAEGALDFLVKTKEQYKNRQDSRRAEDLNKRIEDYRNRLSKKNDDKPGTSGSENNDGTPQDPSGSVKGSSDIEVRLDLPNLLRK